MKDRSGCLGLGCAGGCLSWFVGLIVFNLVFGYISMEYCWETIAGHRIPAFFAIVLGFFFGEFSVPVAIVCYCLVNFCGWHVPFLHQ